MKTKYPRTMHFPFSPGTTSDDRIVKDYSFLENRPIVITEKLDGQNNAITNSAVYARSHAAPSVLPWDREIQVIQNNIKHQLDDDIFLFGENMYAIHSIEYKRLRSYYYLFAVRQNETWLSWDDVELYAELLNLPTVPVLFKGETNDLKSLVLELINQPSVLDGYDTITGETIKEGVVVRVAESFIEDFDKQNYCFNHLLKYVRKGHVKTDEHWTRNWKRAEIYYGE